MPLLAPKKAISMDKYLATRVIWEFSASPRHGLLPLADLLLFWKAGKKKRQNVDG